MNRKQFLQLLALAPVAGLVSRNTTGETVLGDIFVKLGRGETLSPQEIELMRVKMNTVEQTSGLVQGWSQPGKVDPFVDHLEFHSGRGDILPHECAQLYRGTTAQTISNNTWTEVVFEDGIAKTWAHGMSISPAANPKYIELTGIISQSKYLVVINHEWTANAVNARNLIITYNSNTGPVWTWYYSPLANTYHTYSTSFTIRRLAAHTNWGVSVFQDSGDDLDLRYCSFCVMRLR